MIKYYCDRCGGDITGKARYHLRTEDIVFDELSMDYCDRVYIELCEACADSLKRWMARGQGYVNDHRR